MKFYVLAGGGSARMGQNKAIMDVHGIPMIEHVIQAIPAPQDGITIITNTPGVYEFLSCRKLGDIHPGLGPISGVHTGLVDSEEDASFFLPCDLPKLNPKIIRCLLDLYEGQDMFGFRTARGIEPLCTIYSRKCLPVIEKQIKKGNYSLHNLVKHVKSDFIKADDDSVFRNVNTPKDISFL